MAENKTKDLSPKSHFLLTAEQELMFPTVDLPMGQRIGGLSMFGDSFKRGTGNKVFGASNDGIWLGAADFADAPFQVDMEGNATMESATFKDENDTTFIDSKGLISTASFTNDTIADANLNTTTSTSLVDLPGSTFDTITLTRDTKFLIALDIFARNSDIETAAVEVEVSVYDGSTALYSVFATGIYTPFSHHYQFAGRVNIITLASGNHDLKLKYRAFGGGTARVAGFDFSYVQLGN